MVIISNGFNKFHLSVAAAEADRRGLLSLFVTGAYPTPVVRRFISLFSRARSGKIGRLWARGEVVEDERVRAQWLAEVIYALRIPCHRLGLHELSNLVTVRSFREYGAAVARIFRREGLEGRIYHYRAGFGGDSVAVAKMRGMITLCDHSAVHPSVMQLLVENNGCLPQGGREKSINPFWRHIWEDINQADYILVNSDFVKETFLSQGENPARVHVIYLGVDNQFLNAVPASVRAEKDAPLQLLFAGAFSQSKGACVLIEALCKLRDVPWRLKIAGPLASDMQPRYADFFADERVAWLGNLQRDQLAREMARAELFVFPSLAEGSARVVFEALAAGCCVITTPNAGSIVVDRVHGRLVPPGNAKALALAIREAADERDWLWEVGIRNAQLIRERYRQAHYGDQLAKLYDQLLGNSEGCCR